MKIKNLLFFLLSFSFIYSLAQPSINMPNGTGTAVNTTCNATLYDAGGAAGNHGLYQTSSLKLVPATAGLAIKLTFTMFDLGTGAALTIYDGPDNTYPALAVYSDFVSPIGISIVAGPAPNNPDGSLYLEFVSGDNNSPGWIASVTCRAPCQSYNVEIDPNATSKPVVEGVYMNVCKDSCITFGAQAIFLQNNINYNQTQNNTTFYWRFGYTLKDTGQVVTRCFDQARGWDYTLYAIDTMGCSPNTMYKGRIRVADNPIVGAPALPPACSGNEYNVYVGSDPQATVQVTTVGANITGTLTMADTVFLPDGGNICYNSDLLYDVFNPGQLLTNMNDLIGVKVVMEHSYLGDLSIRLTCPSGASTLLKTYTPGNPPPPGSVDNACSFGGGNINLGCAPDPAMASICYNTPGIGWDYEFRPGAYNCFGAGGQTVGYSFTDPCSQTWGGPALLPSVPNIYTSIPTVATFYGSYSTLATLLNCPLNGMWRMTICDHYQVDNGYIFSWSLSLNQAIVPGGWNYNVNLDTVIWHGNNATPIGPTSAKILMNDAGIFNYDVTLVDDYGCEWDTTFTVEVVQSPMPNINNGLDTARLCAGEILILNANYIDTNAVYWWNTGANVDEIMALAEGLYTIEVTASTIDGELTCTGRDSIYVSINPYPVPDFSVDKQEGCAPLNLQFTNLTTPTIVQYDYYWTIYDEQGREVFRSTQKNPNFFVENTGVFHVQLMVISENGCSDSIMKWSYIKVHPQPVAEFSFIPEISLYSENEGLVTFTNYADSSQFFDHTVCSWYWDFGDSSVDSAVWSPTHTYSTWGDYNVLLSIVSNYGCKSTILHTVVIEEDLEFPNIITPNNDGVNDVFAIKNLNINYNPEDPDQYRSNNLQIFDRWGKKVYEEDNYDTYSKNEEIFVGEKAFSGEKLQDGEYYFAFYYKGKAKTVKYSGSLIIVRNN